MAHHAACDHDHDHHGVAGAVLEAELAAAETRCGAAEQRLTAPRRRVLELLLQAGQPVKAYDLIARFGEDGQAAKPPTVYRALEFLERKGLVHRIASISAYVACTAGDRAHAAAFLICDCCGATQEITPPHGDSFALGAEAAGYVIARTTIEGHGLCAACRT